MRLCVAFTPRGEARVPRLRDPDATDVVFALQRPRRLSVVKTPKEHPQTLEEHPQIGGQPARCSKITCEYVRKPPRIVLVWAFVSGCFHTEINSRPSGWFRLRVAARSRLGLVPLLSLVLNRSGPLRVRNRKVVPLLGTKSLRCHWPSVKC
jgi:hypothetical protein